MWKNFSKSKLFQMVLLSTIPIEQTPWRWCKWWGSWPPWWPICSTTTKRSGSSSITCSLTRIVRKLPYRVRLSPEWLRTYWTLSRAKYQTICMAWLLVTLAGSRRDYRMSATDRYWKLSHSRHALKRSRHYCLVDFDATNLRPELENAIQICTANMVMVS